MSDTTRHLRWVAPVVLVGALGLAACGDGDSDATARTAGVGAVAVGSDRHLENLAAEAATNPANVTGSDRHLENLAADIGGRAEDQGPNVFEAGNRAAEAALQAGG
jgi:hypothetical protein